MGTLPVGTPVESVSAESCGLGCMLLMGCISRLAITSKRTRRNDIVACVGRALSFDAGGRG
jgi:hypothetical protein